MSKTDSGWKKKWNAGYTAGFSAAREADGMAPSLDMIEDPDERDGYATGWKTCEVTKAAIAERFGTR